MKISALPSDPRYQVADDGTVYGPKGRALRPWVQHGYGMVKVGDRKRYVHDLVLEAFIGPRPEGLICRHYDGDPANSHLNNLSWDTYSVNNYDLVRHGTHGQASKTHCFQGHEYTPENTRLYINRGWKERVCRACNRQRKAERTERKRKAVA